MPIFFNICYVYYTAFGVFCSAIIALYNASDASRKLFNSRLRTTSINLLVASSTERALLLPELGKALLSSSITTATSDLLLILRRRAGGGCTCTS